jgi:hypothetical protein
MAGFWLDTARGAFVAEKNAPLDFGALRDSAILLLIASQGVLAIMRSIPH